MERRQKNYMNNEPVSVIENEKINRDFGNKNPENARNESELLFAEQTTNEEQVINESPQPSEAAPIPEPTMKATSEKKTAEKTEKDTAEETSEEPTTEPAEEPAKEAAEEPMSEPAEELAEATTEAPTVVSAEEPAEELQLLPEETTETELLETQETAVGNEQQVLFTPFFNDPGSLLTLSIMLALLLTATTVCLVLLRKLGIKSTPKKDEQPAKKKGWKVKK